MTDNVNKNEPIVKRALNAHTVMAVTISAILYIVSFSGTVSVFKDEFEMIEQTGEPVVGALTPKAAQYAGEKAMLRDPETKHLYVQVPQSDNPRAIAGTDNKLAYIDGNGEFSVEAEHTWSEFLIDLHYYLNIPAPFGMMIVAIIGVIMFAISVTGIFAHPNIFKDAFSFRVSKSEQVKQVDLHNRLSVWTMPFHLAISLTGAMIGLASIAAIAVGLLKYDGDFEAVFEPVFGGHPPINLEQGPLANIEKAMTYMNENHPDKPMVLVLVHDPGTIGQFIQIYGEHTDRLIYAEKYNFNGNGEFVGTVGSSDGEIGQQFADSIYKVHFGYYGGYPVKVAYVLLGIALLYIISSGMKIYFIKKRKKGEMVPFIEASWDAVVWGTPIMLILTFVLSRFMGGTYLAAIFWAGIFILTLVRYSQKKKIVQFKESAA